MREENRWFKECMRQVHMDFHMPEFPADAIRNFDAKTFVSHLVRGKINMVALFSKCHFGNSFYNTVAGHKHSGLPNDFLMEATEECHKNGIRVLAYYSLCSDVRAYEHYPHWRAVSADGTAFPLRGPWGPVCLNTPYAEELVLPQLEEIASGYPVDGFWLDIPGGTPCHCRYCTDRYRTLYGKELAEQPDLEIRAFNMEATTRLLRQVRMIRDEHNPALRILTNNAWSLWAPRAMSEQNDIGCWESQPHSNYLSHSYTARYVRTLDTPVQVMSVRFYQGWGDLTLKPAAQMTTEFASMIGNGTMAVSGDQVQVDGTLQAPVYDMFNKAFGFVEEREKLLLECEPVRDAVVLVPVPNRRSMGLHDKGGSQFGAHKALLESQVQFDILSSLDIDKFDQYRTIFLTAPCDYAPDVLDKLRSWVEAGGTLVATADALLRDGELSLDDVFGVEYLGPSVFAASHYLLEGEVAGQTDAMPLQMRGRCHMAVPTTAHTLARLVEPEIEPTDSYSFRNEQCAPPSSRAPRYPFMCVNGFGSGRAVYIAGPLFSTYWRTNHHWLRQTIDGLAAYLEPKPAYRVDAPPVVEANLMRHASGDLVLNVIHYQVGHQASRDAIPAVERVHPMKDVPCRVRADDVARVVLEPEGREVPFTTSDGYVEFVIPEIEYLAIVRLARG